MESYGVIELYLRGVASAYSGMLLVFGLVMVLEVFAPRDRLSIAARAKGLAFWALLLPVDVAFALGGAEVRQSLGVEPLVKLHSSFGSAIAAAIVMGLWTDFTFYWFHRFQHRFLWRFHSVHHSIQDLTAVNSYHHVTEPLFASLLIAVPLWFINIEAMNPAIWLLFVLRAWPFYIHAPTRLHVGPLAGILVDNRVHRIHHSVEPQHFDRNFGAVFTIWDRLFGTFYRPARTEWPDVGLSSRPEPNSVRSWLSLLPRESRASGRMTLDVPNEQTS